MELQAVKAPHIKENENVRTMFGDVCLALIPLVAMSIYYYRQRALAISLISVLTCLLADVFCLRIQGKKVYGNFSSIITGLIIAVSMPASVPYYVVVAAGLFAIMIAKHPFGGLGNNIFNPACAGIVFSTICWKEHMINFPRPADFDNLPILGNVTAKLDVSIVASLNKGDMPTVQLQEMLFGNFRGPMGATCIIVIISCAIFLLYRKSISWFTPASFAVAMIIFSVLLPSFDYEIVDLPIIIAYEFFGGSALFAMIFIATDPVTTPTFWQSKVLYGLGLGFLTMFFRRFGGYAEGVYAAVLVMNALSGFLDSLILDYQMENGLIQRIRERQRIYHQSDEYVALLAEVEGDRHVKNEEKEAKRQVRLEQQTKKRIALEEKRKKEQEERERKRAEEAERKRIEAEKEAERKRVEAEKEAERKRIEAEKEAERKRIEAEEAEKQRIIDEAKAKEDTEKADQNTSEDETTEPPQPNEDDNEKTSDTPVETTENQADSGSSDENEKNQHENVQKTKPEKNKKDKKKNKAKQKKAEDKQKAKQDIPKEDTEVAEEIVPDTPEPVIQPQTEEAQITESAITEEPATETIIETVTDNVMEDITVTTVEPVVEVEPVVQAVESVSAPETTVKESVEEIQPEIQTEPEPREEPESTQSIGELEEDVLKLIEMFGSTAGAAPPPITKKTTPSKSTVDTSQNKTQRDRSTSRSSTTPEQRRRKSSRRGWSAGDGDERKAPRRSRSVNEEGQDGK